VSANDPRYRIGQHLRESAEVTRIAAEHCAEPAARAVELLLHCFRNRGRLLLCGNGGSAADCQHLATEFVSGRNHHRPRPALAAIALTTDTSFLTASANDFGFEQVFARQVEALGCSGDVLLAISTSGQSQNVLQAVAAARKLGLGTIGLTGGAGGYLAGQVDVAIVVPSEDTQHIQETHIALGHALCAEVELALFPGGP
jgi:D-sedoheptulose 7-phosphate isomerase